MKKILVIGSINYDLSTTTKKFPAVGETIKGESFLANCGGKGANQAVACSKLGGKVLLCSAVGNDAFGKESLNSLKGYGVDVSYVKTTNSPTGTALIVVSNKDNFIVINQGANLLVDQTLIEEFLTKNLTKGDIVILQNEILKESLLFAIKRAKALGGFVIVNPSPVDNLTLKELSNVDMLVVNETENTALTMVKGQTLQDLVLSCQEYEKNNVQNVIITLGEKGCFYNGKIYPAEKGVNVVDTTAAGDTFLGALAVCLSQNKKIEKSLDFCQKASSITISRRGAQESIPSIKEMIL